MTRLTIDRLSGARANVAGVEVDNLTEGETLAVIDEIISRGQPGFMAVVNAAKIVEANRNARLSQVLRKADIITADGMSVVWASRLLGSPLKERVTGIDIFERLVAHAARQRLRVFFLGARKESVGKMVARFTAEHPGLIVAGYRDGYFASADSAGVAEQVRRSNADILFVAMGSPAQEFWIESHFAATGARFALGVGGSFDHLSGLARRAPVWMQRAGLEWLYRLASDPRRLWRRYLIGNSLFLWLVLKQGIRGQRPGAMSV
jgi:N-acetylglucosaminyldiphosphoundecaprenol N-acetyl-beta-D-mannosaminyltransferase